MNCPACNRDLASTLSVCPSCGTMVNDSVREELASKISPLAKSAKAIIAKPVQAEIKEKPPAPFVPTSSTAPNPPMILNPPAVPKPPIATSQSSSPMLSIATTKPHTSEIFAKQTSPTLVEFQNRNAVLPEWRLQLQNSVRRRNGNGQSETPANAAPLQTVLVSKGATALKAEPFVEPTPAPIVAANPTLAKALQRIEASRQRYCAEDNAPKQSDAEMIQEQPRTFPHAVPNKPQEFLPKPTEEQVVQSFNAKSKIATSLTEVKVEKFDTNKLPPLPVPAKISSSFEKRTIEETPSIETKIPATENKSFQIKEIKETDVIAYAEAHDEETDDRAPVSLRFNAALFDLIIGSFLSVILIAPFTLSSGNLFTVQGLFAFLATCSIVMFIYLTTTIGTMGKTLGMRLFSLELVDIEENAYPTFHQAAVSSSVYLVSLALGGVGFLTLFMNHEKRAAHDLLSGTIVVKEYE